MDGNLRLAERTLFFCCFFHFFFGMHLLQFVDLADQQEDHKADDEEIDYLGQKRAVIDGGSIVAAAKDDDQIVKVDSAGKETEQRHKDIVYQGTDDSGEGAADDHTDS